MSKSNTALRSLWAALDAERGHGSPNLWNALQRLGAGDIEGGLTPEVVRSLLDYAPARREIGEFTSPTLISDFMASLAEIVKPKSILDPMCGSGMMLLQASETEGVTIVHGVDINAVSCQIARVLLGDRAEIQQADVIQMESGLANEYDLILVDPPLGARLQQSQTEIANQTPGIRDLAQTLAVQACDRLSEKGVLAIVMPPNAIRQRPFIEAINKKECHIRASFHVPAGTRLNTAIPTQILVIQRGPQESLFVGQLSKDIDHQKRLLNNFKRRNSDKHPSLGRVCSLDDFLGYEALEASYRLSKMVRNTSFSSHSFLDLVLDRTRRTSSEDAAKETLEPNATLYLPHGGPRLYSDANLMPERIERYDRLRFDTQKLHAQYLLHWLETDMGKTALRASGGGGLGPIRISRQVLERMTCYLPPVAEQLQTLEALRHLRRVQAEVSDIEQDCWSGRTSGEEILLRAQTVNQEDRYEDWLESLPYPLASILWRHKVSADDPRIRLKTLLQFFEGLAEFLATIHLSAFSSNEENWSQWQKPLLKKLTEQGLSLERATFGTWKLVVEILSSAARETIQDPKQLAVALRLYATEDDQWLNVLANAKLATILSNANGIRNKHDGHGGAMGRHQAEEVENELLEMVEQVRNVFGRRWQRNELVLPDKTEYSGGIFHYQMPRLMGTRNQFERVERTTASPLDSGQLNLLSENAPNGLKLLPFIRFMASPKNIDNACYFYNRETTEGLRFVSYHFEQEAEVCNAFQGTANAITQLTTIPSLPGMEDTD